LLICGGLLLRAGVLNRRRFRCLLGVSRKTGIRTQPRDTLHGSPRARDCPVCGLLIPVQPSQRPEKSSRRKKSRKSSRTSETAPIPTQLHNLKEPHTHVFQLRTCSDGQQRSIANPYSITMLRFGSPIRSVWQVGGLLYLNLIYFRSKDELQEINSADGSRIQWVSLSNPSSVLILG